MSSSAAHIQTTPNGGQKLRAGFCALIGRPNVGKSTLLNRLVGEKVAIVTPKPQTTRTRIVGVFLHEETQIALLDTPGLTAGANPLLGALRKTAARAASEADVTVVVAEAQPNGAELSEADNAVLACARRGGGKIILALNKVDLLADKRWLLPQSEAYAKVNDIHAIVPISAAKGEGIEKLVKVIAEAMPEGPHLFDADTFTTEPERALCAELVREQLLLRLQAEVPHCLHVVIDEFEDGRDAQNQDSIVHLYGRIIVARTSQKAIVIGDGGQTIRTVSTHARKHIERLLGSKVFLRLQVEVDAKWNQRPESLRKLGLDLSAKA